MPPSIGSLRICTVSQLRAHITDSQKALASSFDVLLRIADRKSAGRRLDELQAQIGNLSVTDAAAVCFEHLVHRRPDTTGRVLEASCVVRRHICIKNCASFFKSVSIRRINARGCQALAYRPGSVDRPTHLCQ